MSQAFPPVAANWSNEPATPETTQPNKPWILPASPEAVDFTAPIELPYSLEGLNEDQIQALTMWENAKAILNKVKTFEMEMRKAIVYDGGFFTEDKTSGTEHITLGGGYSLTSVKKENYNLDSNKVEAALTNFSDDLAELLVSWKATLSVSAYKKLTEPQQAFFNDCLEITNGAPTLEVKATKVKG